MKKYNVGEWSEIYVFLKLLENGEFIVVSDDLETIKDKYEIVKIFKKNFENTIEKEWHPTINDKFLKNIIKEMLSTILKTTEKTFSIKIVDDFAKEKDFSLNKGSSYSKSDLDAIIKDASNRFSPRLGYSIKSKLSSMPTLLNASSHTNFIYKIEGLSRDKINEINNINSNKKLKDRYNKILELGGKIKFIKVASKTFKYNLDFLDGDLEFILGNILLYSYSSPSKDIKKLLEIFSKKNILENFSENTYQFYERKILKFLEAISFKMQPGTLIDAQFMENLGGILIVKKNGEVVLLDRIYYSNILNKYLLENIKLDSPSSSRYRMLELYEENGEIYFTLNLQIRFN